jgi:hypothetical protein
VGYKGGVQGGAAKRLWNSLTVLVASSRKRCAIEYLTPAIFFSVTHSYFGGFCFGPPTRRAATTRLLLYIYMVVFCSCCGRDFAEALDLANHTSRPNSICGGALGLGVVQQHERLLADARAAQVAVSNAPAIAAMEKDRRQQHRDDTRAAMLQKLQVQRFGKLRGAPSIADGKALVATAVQQIKPELMRRIAPMLKEGERSVDLLRAVVNETCDVFGQLQLTEHDLLPILSEKGEMAAHAKDLHDTMVHAVERELGWRELRSHDAEGVGFGRMRKRRSFCYDVPVDATLRRLLQCDARAWEQVKSASQRWGSVRDGASGSETILFDIPDAEYFRNHPELGIQADPTDRRIRLAFILYYDGLGTSHNQGNILVFSATSVLMQPVRYAERQDGTADVSLLL